MLRKDDRRRERQALQEKWPKLAVLLPNKRGGFDLDTFDTRDNLERPISRETFSSAYHRAERVDELRKGQICAW